MQSAAFHLQLQHCKASPLPTQNRTTNRARFHSLDGLRDLENDLSSNAVALHESRMASFKRKGAACIPITQPSNVMQT